MAMEAAANAETRSALFQQLKPCCVAISRLTIKADHAPSSNRELQTLTASLLHILRSSPSGLHEKLAEYVFFPLSHVFRRLEHYPTTVIENCLACLRLLIVHGWEAKMSANLAQQIFTLLIFIADGVPGAKKTLKNSEELILEVFRTMTALLDRATASVHVAAGLAAPTAIPTLGQGVTVMLNGIADGVTPEIQREATRSLISLHQAIRDHSVLATFLPGTISNLAKVLHTAPRYKISVLAGCLDAVRVVLLRVLGDLRTRSILAAKNEDEVEKKQDKNKVLGAAWLKATTEQVKKALASFMKLRAHESEDVKDALNRLCIALLDECHETLSNCSQMVVETAVILDSGESKFNTDITLSHLAGIYPELLDAVKTTVYNWMSSLPRHMQSADEAVKRIAIHNFAKGIKLLQNFNIESSTLDSALSSTMCETVISLIQASKSTTTDNAAPIQLLETNSMVMTAGKTVYPPVLLSHESQRSLKKELMSLIRAVSSTAHSGELLYDMLDTIRDTSGNSQVAAYWLAFETVKAFHADSDDQTEFNILEMVNDSSDVEPAFSDLYSFSVELLDSRRNLSTIDWRMEAIALEIVAYSAKRSGQSFRPKLVDVLFPIATFMGSDNHRLQQHAVATLNLVASACEFDSVSELIVSNVDYMVNSVALRLNTLDISPASTQVLTMMIRLAGPRLIPFLDDVVESIFAALGNYHGYPAFVEGVFDVLKEIVDQGAKTETGRLLKDHERKEVRHKKQKVMQKDLNSLIAFFDERRIQKHRDEEEARNLRPLNGHPETPWGEIEKTDDNEIGDSGNEPPNEEKPKSSSTYQLLNRVANLTQYYLTSPTPKLRRSLLELLKSASMVLAADEDSFLPLVNAVWPVVISRLRDPEPFVVIEACTTLAGLCEAAGDFLTTRFKTEWQDGLFDFCRQAKRAAEAGQRTVQDQVRRTIGGYKVPLADVTLPSRSESGLNLRTMTLTRQDGLSSTASLGQHASPARIWASVVSLLTAVVAHVHIDEVMFDDVLDLLVDVLDKRPETKEALDVINADAVWLARYENGMEEELAVPKTAGALFIPLRM